MDYASSKRCAITNFNDCPKVTIDGYTRPQINKILLLKVFLRELHNSLVSELEDGGLKEARDAENNIIIIDSTLHSLFPPKIKNISMIQGHV